MSGKECPECGAEMESDGVTGNDHKGRSVGVSWDECPECETVIDDMGNTITPDERGRSQR